MQKKLKFKIFIIGNVVCSILMLAYGFVTNNVPSQDGVVVYISPIPEEEWDMELVEFAEKAEAMRAERINSLTEETEISHLAEESIFNGETIFRIERMK